MQEEQQGLTFEERIAVLDERIKHLSRLLPPTPQPVHAFPRAQRTESDASDPLQGVQRAIGFLLFLACAFSVGSVQRILFDPDTPVIVSTEEGKFHVWPDIGTYEVSTGKKWERVPFHGLQKAVSEEALPTLILAVVLLFYAYRRVRTVRRGAAVDPKTVPSQQG